MALSLDPRVFGVDSERVGKTENPERTIVPTIRY